MKRFSSLAHGGFTEARHHEGMAKRYAVYRALAGFTCQAPVFVRLAFNFYDQKDGGGNPRLREDMTVMEPMILISKTLSERWSGSLKAQADIITAASVENRKRFPAGTQTRASGDKYFGLDAGCASGWGPSRPGMPPIAPWRRSRHVEFATPAST
ncbi:MAG: hypothetical protein HYY16_18850 [Planctomycetes bacterium]|nr:hypothetical protein [Planctomycetota bacterium]